MTRILILLFLIISVNLSAQHIVVTAKIQLEDTTFNTSTKQFSVLKKRLNSDTLIHQWQENSNEILKKIELSSGKYIFRVKTADGGSKSIDFNVSDKTQQTIELGTIVIPSKVGSLEAVTVTGIPKKMILIDPEKTTVLVENNAVLERGSIYDAILKIPGIIPNPNGGFTFSGQMASVFFEGIPSSLNGSDLDNLLRGLPATTVKKIELVTNPGASYDANFSGVIIDIISRDKTFKWLSGSVNLTIGFNYNFKAMPSFVISGKAKKFSWNIQGNYSFQEHTQKNYSTRIYTFIDSLPKMHTNRKEQSADNYYSVRTNLTQQLNHKSFIQLNVGTGFSTNQTEGNAVVTTEHLAISPFTNQYLTNNNWKSINGGFKYRWVIDSLNRKLDVSGNYNADFGAANKAFEQQRQDTIFSYIQSQNMNQRIMARADFECPFKNKITQLNFGVKLSLFTGKNTGKYHLNDSISNSWNAIQFSTSLPFVFVEKNLAAYTEFKQRIGKKFAFTLGLRAEDYGISGRVQDTLTLQKAFKNLYPSLHMMYRLGSDINLSANYSRKINMPYFGMFDPNFTGYYDSYTKNTGNNNLNPNFLHRSQIKLTIFEYLQISASHVFSNAVNFSEVSVDSLTQAVNYSYKTYSNVQSLSFFGSIPVPFGMFKEGLAFFQKEINVDEVSFLYIYGDWNKTFIPNYQYINPNKAQWTFGVYSQFILPLKIRLNVEYNFSGKGLTQITEYTRPIHEIETVISREFDHDKWRVSFTIQDVLNSSRTYSRVVYNPLTNESYTKWDTRTFWFKVAYSFGKYERPSLKENAIPIKG